MKKYTQEEFDLLPVDEYGYKICPTGDYTEINFFVGKCIFGKGCRFGKFRFGKGCRFGKYCSFGERCSFGECCSFGNNCICEFGEFTAMISFGGFGSEQRTTYAFKLTDGGIGVRCGCFAGNLEEFKNKVKQTHKDSKFAKSYLMIADLIEFEFKE